jgi:hypothetical protein
VGVSHTTREDSGHRPADWSVVCVPCMGHGLHLGAIPFVYDSAGDQDGLGPLAI